MSEREFQNQFNKLLEKINTLPSDQQNKLKEIASETKGRHDQMKKTITELQDSLDYLRVSVKYLVFDLEATRRENKQLRSLLERRPEGDM
jgi:peptidoglycan hydrolase CwlO-like protein